MIYSKPMAPNRSSGASVSRRVVIALSAIVLFLAIVLIGMNALLSIIPGSNSDALQKAYAQGYRDARVQLSALCTNVNQPQSNVSGIVQSVGNGSFVIKQDSLAVNAQVDNVPDNRTVLVSSTTTVVSVTMKPTSQFAAEQEAFAANFKPGSGLVPPSPFTTASLSPSDIKPGERVTVYTNQDIRTLAQFTAVTVQVQPAS